jgi:hypothetical protein
MTMMTMRERKSLITMTALRETRLEAEDRDGAARKETACVIIFTR